MFTYFLPLSDHQHPFSRHLAKKLYHFDEKEEANSQKDEAPAPQPSQRLRKLFAGKAFNK